MPLKNSWEERHKISVDMALPRILYVSERYKRRVGSIEKFSVDAAFMLLNTYLCLRHSTKVHIALKCI